MEASAQQVSSITIEHFGSRISNYFKNIPHRVGHFFESYRLIYGYIAKEFALSFLVSFTFFFFIFFINQLLLMLKNVSVENLSIRVMLELVILSIPQFLIYTFPFAALAGSSMVIGDLSSKNEILAFRASGISITHVFVPIVLISFLIGGSAYFTADVINPWSARQYKNMYSRIIEDMPSVALRPYSVTTIGRISISVGNVDGTKIYDVTILDTENSSENRVISASEGEIKVLDKKNYIYGISLYNPDIVFTDENNVRNYSISRAGEFQYSLDLSSLLPSFGEPTPTQVSTKDLNSVIVYQKGMDRQFREDLAKEIKETESTIRDFEFRLENEESFYEATSLLLELEDAVRKKTDAEGRSYSRFRMRYYQSELHKRFALSLACVILVFVAFPISFFKVRHGRLLGFGLSIFVAVVYWGVMFFAQVRSVQTENTSVVLLMWLPNIVFLLVSLVFLNRLYKT